MEKQTNSRTKPKKPLYYKKSKAAKEDDELDDFEETEDSPQRKPYKQRPSRIKKSSRYNREYEYSDYDDEYEGNIEDSPQPKIYRNSPSRMKKSSRYNREYEYIDYGDEFGGSQYNYDYEKQMYDSGEETFDYTTEDTSKFRRNPGKTRQYYSRTETEYVDDSDSDCLACTSRRGQRSDYTSENPSQYQREDMSAPRYRNTHRQNVRKRKIIPSETEIERGPYRHKNKSRPGNRRQYHKEYEEEFDYGESPYRNNYETNGREKHYRRTPQEVYVARAPDGYKAFTKQHHDLEEQTSGSRSEMDVYDEEVKEEPGWRQNQSRYQVFAANTGENQVVFQKQPNQNKRETLLSVTEYNNSVPLVALKKQSATKSPDKSQSIVYLPVVVMDNDIKLPRSKVVPAETILQTIRHRDKAEKPLDTHMNVYLQTEDGQGNIFQQAQRNGLQEITTQENIQVYTTQSTHSTPIEKKPTVLSKIVSKIKSKNKPDYPVQKSYINVAPSKTKPLEQKGSKISISSRGSKKSLSHVGEDKSKSSASAHNAKMEKKEIKNKKLKRKITSGDSDSELLSVINPMSTDDRSHEPRTNTIKSTKGDVENQQNIHRSASQISMKKDANITKQSTFDRHVPPISHNHNKNGTSESTVKNVPSKQNVLERQSSKGKDSGIVTIKDVTGGHYEKSKHVFGQSEADLPLEIDDLDAAAPKKKGLGSSLFHKKESKIKSGHSKDITPTHKNDPYTFNPDESASSYATVKREKSKEGIRRPKKSHSAKTLHPKRTNTGLSSNQDVFQFWRILRFDSYAFKYIYLAIQYFLGLSIHGTLMEILRNVKHSD